VNSGEPEARSSRVMPAASRAARRRSPRSSGRATAAPIGPTGQTLPVVVHLIGGCGPPGPLVPDVSHHAKGGSHLSGPQSVESPATPDTSADMEGPTGDAPTSPAPSMCAEPRAPGPLQSSGGPARVSSPRGHDRSRRLERDRRLAAGRSSAVA
jgi:hypothetical protein